MMLVDAPICSTDRQPQTRLTCQLTALCALFVWVGFSLFAPQATASVGPRPQAKKGKRAALRTVRLRKVQRLRKRKKKQPRRWVSQSRTGSTTIQASKRCRVNWRVRVLVNFEKSKLLTVVKWISKQTCQNFILSSRVRGGNLHIISRTKVPLRAAYQAFFTALKANKFTAYKVGSFWKIIFARNARKSPIRTIINRRGALPYRDELVTYMHRLKHLSANQVVGTVRYLSSSSGGIIPYQPSGILIINDYANNIRRILKVLKALDVPQAETRDSIYVLQVKHAEAQNIASKLQQLFKIGKQRNTRTRRVRRLRRVRRTKKRTVRRTTAGKNKDADDEDAYRITKMIADERTNQLVLLCNPRALKRVSQLLKDLDVPLPGDGQIRVHYLKYASSDELAQTLSQLTNGTKNRRTSRRRRRSRTRKAKASELFEGEVKITSDKATNSLVIVASRRDYESLLNVIKKLDVARKQVFVEIAILEVSMNKSNELGLTFHQSSNLTGDTTNPTLSILGTSLGGINSLVLDPTALLGLAFGLRGASVPGSEGLLGGSGTSTTGTTGGISIGVPSFGVIIRAIQSNSDVDIISTPHILTTANQEATLQVGQNVPFIAGTTFTGGAVAGVPPIRNIQRQDVALTIKLKPQVDQGSYVRLDFEQELTELDSQDPELGPTTTKRKIKTVILAKDRQTVVIGGLVRKRVSNSTSKVPILGDIPLLGALFRVKKKDKEKRNLLVFLTPYIINGSEDFRKIFELKMKERKQFMKLFYAGKPQRVPDTYNYDRAVGLFNVMDNAVQRGKKEAKQMSKQKVKPISSSKSSAKAKGRVSKALRKRSTRVAKTTKVTNLAKASNGTKSK